MTVRESKETVRAFKQKVGPDFYCLGKLLRTEVADVWAGGLTIVKYYEKVPLIEGSDASDLPAKFNAGDSLITGVEQAIAWATKPNIKP